MNFDRLYNLPATSKEDLEQIKKGILAMSDMKDPMDKIEDEVQHLYNHVHWWHAKHITTHEELIKTLECIKTDATKIVEEAQQWLIEINS